VKNVIKMTDDNFDREIKDSSTPVLVDFSAEWCGPCKQLAPIVEELAGEYAGRIKVGHLDIDEGQQTAVRFGVMSVPTLIFFKNGKVADQLIGLQRKQTLVDRISRLLQVDQISRPL